MKTEIENTDQDSLEKGAARGRLDTLVSRLKLLFDWEFEFKPKYEKPLFVMQFHKGEILHRSGWTVGLTLKIRGPRR